MSGSYDVPVIVEQPERIGKLLLQMAAIEPPPDAPG